MNVNDDDEDGCSGSSNATKDDNSTKAIANVILVKEMDDHKRASAKKLIEQYFYQLLEGCGQQNCLNKNCASSGFVKNLTPNQAAAKAIQLYSQDSKLCVLNSTHLANTHNSGSLNRKTLTVNDEVDVDHENEEEKPLNNSITDDYESTLLKQIPQTSKSSQNNYLDVKEIESINETEFINLIDVCNREKSYSMLIRKLGSIFSCREKLAASFQIKPSDSIDAMLEKAPKDLKSLKKEDLRILEGDLDKDEDSSTEKTVSVVPHHTTVDLISLRRAMNILYENNASVFEPLNNAIHSLATSLCVDLRLLPKKEEIESIVTVFVIIFEIFNIAKIEFIELAVPNICAAITYLPISAQARLCHIWSYHCKDNLSNLLEMLQQMITLHVIYNDYRDTAVQDDEVIINATKVMKIFYYANIMAGKIEPIISEDDDDTTTTQFDVDEVFYYLGKTKNRITDQLGIELNVNVMDCRKPFIPFQNFYNESLSEIIEMDKDYFYYKKNGGNESGKPFSFMLYSFILTPAIKTVSLYFDNRIRMYSEHRISLLQMQLSGQQPSPYLKLKVRRDKLIDDALVELELVAMEVPKDLKKQLYVEFIGEQGVDEGGVSKEFFQLIVEQIFNPDYGMFIHNEDSNNVWFNSTSFENKAQFTLIGIVLGLAIYNNIILAVNFPMVVYRKLMSIRGTFSDLEDLNPILYKNLKALIDYQEYDIEDVFMQTFKITYSDIFGNLLYHELKPNGDNIFVNQDNKQEFIDLYADFLLNKSIEKQFIAFKRGFQMVTDESPLQLLFRPEEIELLVCGSKQFDFNELEQAAEYDAGYTAKTQIIIDFWKIVHGLSMESKKKLLEFTTGSDRVPVGGLCRLKLVIARNGPDCDRLPTSHTCFNVLLLPEYSTKDKLEDRLLKAINYSKGFGMI